MYIVLEIQKNADGTVGTIVNSVSSYPEALNRYFTISAAAAVSNVQIHSVVLMSDNGATIRTESFPHGEIGGEEETYLVLEIQKNADGTIGTIPNSVTGYMEALNRYLTMLAAAAISSVAEHSVVLMNMVGGTFRQETFVHTDNAVTEGEINE